MAMLNQDEWKDKDPSFRNRKPEPFTASINTPINQRARGVAPRIHLGRAW
jgi:hypothetical protein